MEPYVVFPGEGKKDFTAIKVGDRVRVVAVIEPLRTPSPDVLALELILKKVEVDPPHQAGPKRRKLGLVESVAAASS